MISNEIWNCPWLQEYYITMCELLQRWIIIWLLIRNLVFILLKTGHATFTECTATLSIFADRVIPLRKLSRYPTREYFQGTAVLMMQIYFALRLQEAMFWQSNQIRQDGKFITLPPPTPALGHSWSWSPYFRILGSFNSIFCLCTPSSFILYADSGNCHSAP